MPDNIYGLLLFLAGIGPGYVFLRVGERREPRQARSALLEFAELFVIGAATTAAASIVVLLVGEVLDQVDLKTWLSEGRIYVINEPFPVLVTLMAILSLSYLGAWGLARLVYKGRPASIRPEFSVWFQVFHVDEEKPDVAELRFATVELKDGRRVAGYVHAYTVDPNPENRELALRKPIFAQAGPEAPRQLIPDAFLIVPSEEIVYVSVQLQVMARA
jgi:Family of unknown function (DUF6338)